MQLVKLRFRVQPHGWSTGRDQWPGQNVSQACATGHMNDVNVFYLEGLLMDLVRWVRVYYFY